MQTCEDSYCTNRRRRNVEKHQCKGSEPARDTGGEGRLKSLLQFAKDLQIPDCMFSLWVITPIM